LKWSLSESLKNILCESQGGREVGKQEIWMSLLFSFLGNCQFPCFSIIYLGHSEDMTNNLFSFLVLWLNRNYKIIKISVICWSKCFWRFFQYSIG
jgi:hypothetical protein